MKKIILLTALLTASAQVAFSASLNSADEPMKIEQSEILRFPNYLAFQGVTKGRADVAIAVDENGKIVDILATAYTRKAFAEEAVRAAKLWKYTPAKRNGVSHPTVTYLAFTFESEGVMVSRRIDEMTEVFLRGDRMPDLQMKITPLKEIDRIPTPKNVVTPGYSKKQELAGVKGSVVVEFLIDETGKVRMPTVVSADDSALAVEAIASVRAWEFEPPTARGIPVIVRANQEFRFEPKGAATATAP